MIISTHATLRPESTDSQDFKSFPFKLGKQLCKTWLGHVLVSEALQTSAKIATKLLAPILALAPFPLRNL